MKKMNFISSISPHEQQSITRWYRTSLLIIVALLGCIALFTGYQWYQLSLLRSLHQSLSTSLCNLDTVLDTNRQLTQQHTKLNEYSAQASTIAKRLEYPLACLALVHSSLTSESNLASLSLADRALNATLHCSSPSASATASQTLAHHTCMRTMKIHSLQSTMVHNKPTVVVALQGTMAERS